MEEGGHPREAELADEDGGVEAGIALLGLDRLAAFRVGLRECSQNWRVWRWPVSRLAEEEVTVTY